MKNTVNSSGTGITVVGGRWKSGRDNKLLLKEVEMSPFRESAVYTRVVGHFPFLCRERSVLLADTRSDM